MIMCIIEREIKRMHSLFSGMTTAASLELLRLLSPRIQERPKITPYCNYIFLKQKLRSLGYFPTEGQALRPGSIICPPCKQISTPMLHAPVQTGPVYFSCATCWTPGILLHDLAQQFDHNCQENFPCRPSAILADLEAERLAPTEISAPSPPPPVLSDIVAKSQTKKEIHWISIEGNISTGKTFLAERLKLHFEGNPYVTIVQEPREKWAELLQIFYDSNQSMPHALQCTISATFFDAILEALKQYPLTKLIVTDRSFFSGPKVFAPVLQQLHVFSQAETQFLCNAAQGFLAAVGKLGLQYPKFVFLSIEEEQQIRNLRQRGISYEQAISNDYLRQIELQHFRWLEEEKGNAIFLLNSPETKGRMLEIARKALQGNFEDFHNTGIQTREEEAATEIDILEQAWREAEVYTREGQFENFSLPSPSEMEGNASPQESNSLIDELTKALESHEETMSQLQKAARKESCSKKQEGTPPPPKRGKLSQMIATKSLEN